MLRQHSTLNCFGLCFCLLRILLSLSLLVSGKVRATTQINKTESLLHKIFVSSTERMIGLPKVNFIEIFGKTVADNKDISEKVHP